VVKIEPRELARWLPLSGTLQPVNQTTVKAKVSGEIRQVLVRDGEAIKTGQVLARFDTADLEAKLTDCIGALEASRAQMVLAEKTRSQNHALLKQGFISQNAYDSAESNLSVTQGTLKSFEAQVQLARNALRDAVVTAPLSGTLAKRHVQPGEKVNFDSPLFTIVDLGKMELQAMVLNIFSIIGLIMLMGLVTKNAILLVDFANRARRAGASLNEAVAQAGQVRLRPILMTTAAMIGGMLPLALGLGESGETQAPMGRAIIGGVITSTLLTLVVVPVIYTYLAGWSERWKARRAVRRLAAKSQPAVGD
jgi:multidrug efflux pump subunit AcrA (membrane-fusion protein)